MKGIDVYSRRPLQHADGQPGVGKLDLQTELLVLHGIPCFFSKQPQHFSKSPPNKGLSQNLKVFILLQPGSHHRSRDAYWMCWRDLPRLCLLLGTLTPESCSCLGPRRGWELGSHRASLSHLALVGESGGTCCGEGTLGSL